LTMWSAGYPCSTIFSRLPISIDHSSAMPPPLK
jgi:hypothetical protein